MEAAALSRHALHADSAVHQRDEGPANREAEAGAAKAAGDRAIGLHIFFEYAGDVFGCDADAGIGDLKLNPVWRTGIERGHADVNAALFGEFDGVTDEIDQDLA